MLTIQYNVSVMSPTPEPIGESDSPTETPTLTPTQMPTSQPTSPTVAPTEAPTWARTLSPLAACNPTNDLTEGALVSGVNNLILTAHFITWGADTVDVDVDITVTGAKIRFDPGGPPSGQARVAIYTDNALTPGNKVAESDIITLTSTEATLPFTPPKVVSPGTYWLATLFDSGVMIQGNSTAGDVFATGNVFASGFPPTFPSGPTFTMNHRAVWLVRCAN